jgi:hypothetical protein
VKEGFSEQLDAFLKDTSEQEKYGRVEIGDQMVLIEIFRYRTKEGKFVEDKSDIPTILIQNPLSGGITTNKDFFVDYTHVAKVIKAGAETNYKNGDCVLLNPFDVCQETRNPQWLHFMEYQKAAGMEAIPPDDMREFIPSIQVHYIEYTMALPEDYDRKIQDANVFLIPSHKIKAKYNV